MARYEITAPNGERFEITAPDDATEQQIMAYAQSQWSAKPAVEEPAYDPSEGGGRFSIGFSDKYRIDTGIETPQGVDRFLSGMGKAFSDLGAGTKQLFGADNQQEIAEQKELDKALMNTGAGMAGNITGSVAPAVATAFVPGANTLTGSAAGGAILGLLQPQAEGDVVSGKLKDAAINGALAPAAILAGRTLHAGYNGAKGLMEPFYKGGQENIVGRVLNRFATNADDAAYSANSTSAALPGYQPTLAELTQDPGLATLQRSVTATEGSGLLGARDAENLGVVKSAIKGIAGDDAAMSAAMQARKQAAGPLYDQVAKSTAIADASRPYNLVNRMIEANPANKALTKPLTEIRDSLVEDFPLGDRAATGWKHLNDIVSTKTLPQREWNALTGARKVMSQVRSGRLDADEALAQLDQLGGARATTNDAIQYARDLIKTPDLVLRDSPQGLKSAMDNINGLLANPENATVKRALTTVKKSLGNQIRKAEPAYGEATKTFAKMSEPINQMQVGQALYNKLAPALDDFSAQPGARAGLFAEALRNGDRTVKTATGMNRSIDQVMTPEQMGMINSVGDVLAKRASAQAMAKGVGSNTAQNLASQNIVRQIAGPLGAPERFMDARFWPTVLRPAQFALQAQEPQISGLLAQAMLDPKIAAKLMTKKAVTDPALPGLLAEKGARYLLMPGLLGANTAQQ